MKFMMEVCLHGIVSFTLLVFSLICLVSNSFQASAQSLPAVKQGMVARQASTGKSKGKLEYGQRAQAPNVTSGSEKGQRTPSYITEPVVQTNSQSLNSLVLEFKANPNDVTWSQVVQALRGILADTANPMSDIGVLLKSNVVLSELAVRVIDAGPVKVLYFPKVQQARQLLICWRETRLKPTGRRKIPSVAVTTAHAQELILPASVTVKEAKIIEVNSAKAKNLELEKGEKISSTLGLGAREKKSANESLALSKEKKAHVEGGRFLILLGVEQATNSMWLASYRLVAGGFKESNEPFLYVPPLLLHNIKGRLSFSGQDIVITSDQEGESSANLRAAGPKPTVQLCDRLILRLVDGRYTLEGKPISDTPYNTVYQFLKAVQQGRGDLAKIWLLDPKLLSIAKYAGLFAKAQTAPQRIINIACPLESVFRFRIVTFNDNDLIVDVAKTKAQWAIKAIFVAPVDVQLQKIVRTLPQLEKDAPEIKDEEVRL